MSLVLPMTLLAGGAGLGFALLAATEQAPAQAQHHFMRAHTLSQGRLLLVPLLEAQYYAVQGQDRALFAQRLQYVLDAPETLAPEHGLLNAVAKYRAALLLRRIDELFL